MKKLLAILLAISIALTCACALAEAKTELTAACCPAYAPYESMDGEAMVGFDVDFAAALSKELGVSIKLENVEFAQIIPDVAEGKYDLGLSCLTITEDRAALVDFTVPYLEDSQCCIVRADGVVTDEDTLMGMLIGAQTGSVGIDEALGYTEDENVYSYLSADLAVERLLASEVDAVITNKVVGERIVKAAAPGTLQMLDNLDFGSEPIGIALGKGNDELKAKLDAAIDKLVEDGTLYELVLKWDLYGDNFVDE